MSSSHRLPTGFGCCLLGTIFCAAGALAVNSPPLLSDALVAATNFDWCQLHSEVTDGDAEILVRENCRRVDQAAADFQALDDSKAGGVNDTWKERVVSAQTLCATATLLPIIDAKDRARLAMRAWGWDLMSGLECCNLATPPFCSSPKASRVEASVVLGLGALAVLCVCLSPYVCRRSVDIPSHLRLQQPRPQPPPRNPATTSVLGAARSQQVSSLLAHQLKDIFMKESSLRVLPRADEWAVSSAVLLAELQWHFGFQADSAKNQFEHFLSLWRSQCSMVADRVYSSSGQNSAESASCVREDHLLQSGLGELHGELLDGFKSYRDKLRKHDKMGTDVRAPTTPVRTPPGSHTGASRSREPLPFEGLHWPTPPALPHQLAEILTFLAVWGEAGNLRFMPELICFLTDVVLTSDVRNKQTLFPSSPALRSAPFLARVLRPIYNVVFDETYRSVIIDPKTGKDVKSLHNGFAKFLPPDAANYDDWNELFCDAPRLVESLLVEDGSKFFELPAGQRFEALPRVDWDSSLRNAKTHREIHSLFGLFASTHRIWFLHAALYCSTMVLVTSNNEVYNEDSSKSGRPILLLGRTFPVRLAAVSLLVPLHAIVWTFSDFATRGAGARSLRIFGEVTTCQRCWAWCKVIVKAVVSMIFWLSCLPTYALIRFFEAKPDAFESYKHINTAKDALLGAHFFLSGCGAIVILFIPSLGSRRPPSWPRTRAGFQLVLVRYTFWVLVMLLKVFLGYQGLKAMNEALEKLHIARPGAETISDLDSAAFDPIWDRDFFLWAMMMGTGFVLYITDTQFWFSLGCSILGMLVALKQRGLIYPVFRIPELFTQKVLYFTALQEDRRISFPMAWDKIVEWFRYEDKIDDFMAGELSYFSGRSDLTWGAIQQPLRAPRQENAASIRIKLPQIFQEAGPGDRLMRRLNLIRDHRWPENAEVRWRLSSLARGLAYDLPRPFRAPYFPGLTVLIPHYGETILMSKEELFKDELGNEAVPLMSWLEYRYEQEFRAFIGRMSQRYSTWANRGTKWGDYSPEDWDKMVVWASMRNQTLWRTVAGMTLYHQAIEAHYHLQGDKEASMAAKGVWNVGEVFTCMVSMQMYPFFNQTQFQHTNRMLEKFPPSLQIAFIDYAEKGVEGDADGIHPLQERRYYSCLINSRCPADPRHPGRRLPRLKIELPGYPILGDGKGDNQNHAIPFSRGMFIQAIDANQGAYFEQMLLLPCALGEFRTGPETGWTKSRKIVGFPEHITSDIGSIGDFAAGAESAFGTILQRSYCTLGARMHYGHPDIVNKAFMIQQGGISKATKTVNLSEDIFAGMDFSLRGQGRTIQHSEYFHVTKGRDLGFGTVLLFFSKLSAGTAEQLLTRQMARLGRQLGLPELLAFYYAHGGFYLTQYLLSKSMPLLVSVWLLALAAGAESNFSAMDPSMPDKSHGSAEVMADFLVAQFAWIMVLFLIAGTAPLLCETWLQDGLLPALTRFIKQMLTLAPLHFIFQAKIIGAYVSTGLLYGGASYVSTGRGLPTERRFFIGVKGASRGLYNDYAEHALYDGAKLLVSSLLAVFLGGLSVSSGSGAELLWWLVALGITISSWLFAPFIFNPYQYASSKWSTDIKDWCDFFCSASPAWTAWYRTAQLKPGNGIRAAPTSALLWAAFIAAWWTVFKNKFHLLPAVFRPEPWILVTRIFGCLPPVILSFVFCLGCQAVVQYRGVAQVRLIGSMTVVLLLDIIETVLGLWELLAIYWWKACVAGLVVKYALLSALLAVAENCFRLRPSTTTETTAATTTATTATTATATTVATTTEDQSAERGVRALAAAREWLARSVETWLFAHRMARDVAISGLILTVLSIGVLGNFLRTTCGCRCSPHNLLIYRDPGHPTHTDEELFDQNLNYTGSFSCSTQPPREGPSPGRMLPAAAFSGKWGAEDPGSAPTPPRRLPGRPSSSASASGGGGLASRWTGRVSSGGNIDIATPTSTASTPFLANTGAASVQSAPPVSAPAPSIPPQARYISTPTVASTTTPTVSRQTVSQPAFHMPSSSVPVDRVPSRMPGEVLQGSSTSWSPSIASSTAVGAFHLPSRPLQAPPVTTTTYSSTYMTYPSVQPTIATSYTAPPIHAASTSSAMPQAYISPPTGAAFSTGRSLTPPARSVQMPIGHPPASTIHRSVSPTMVVRHAPPNRPSSLGPPPQR